jgi:uncharacterized membrane protein
VSDLIILAYRSQPPAFNAGEALAALQQAAGTEPEDIVVVTKTAAGRVSVHQSIDLATGKPLGGGRWGVLIGMLFLDKRDPGQARTGLVAQFADTGLDQTFLVSVSQSLTKGGAAVGLRVRLLGMEKVLKALAGLKGNPKILTTRLSPETEDALYDLQAQIPQQVITQLSSDDLI